MEKTMQHEIIEAHDLLDSNGHLSEAGFAKSPLLNYDRLAIKARRHKIKEWDSYIISCDDFAVVLTISDNAYMGFDSISLLDFNEPREHTGKISKTFALYNRFGRKRLLSSGITDDVTKRGKGGHINITHNGDHIVLDFHMEHFEGAEPIDGKLRLVCPPDNAMVIALPFAGKETDFYYGQKINCMPATGAVTFGDKTYEFPKGRSFGMLDRGRGAWTYKAAWYRGGASGISRDGKRIGWSIGSGLGDPAATSENAIFYDGKLHKLSNVSVRIPMKNKIYTTHGGCCGSSSGKCVVTMDLTEDYMGAWTFTGDEGRFEMEFAPILDRVSGADIKLPAREKHQVFGKFTGKLVLDDGTAIEVEDFLGFAEKI